ncbi:MAG: hypothetical protein J1E38_10505, partial [Paramuribaculum sp.]|nr:hypothetical protein [Paramuribaculum sp.]
MGLFSKKKSLIDTGVFEGFTDWHSHILPGVDDGIPTMEDALAVLEEYERMGFKKVWLTPHVMEDYPNTPEDLRKRFEELKANWKGNVELALASENMLDNLFEERLESNDFLPIGKDPSSTRILSLLCPGLWNPPCLICSCSVTRTGCVWTARTASW